MLYGPVTTMMLDGPRVPRVRAEPESGEGIVHACPRTAETWP